MELKGAAVHPGSGEGRLLVLEKPLSFWGGVDPLTGKISDPRHPQHGTRLRDRILVMERTIGSSSSSAVMLELLRNRAAPAGIVVGRPDAILVLGVLVADELGYDTIPVASVGERGIERIAESGGVRATLRGGTLCVEHRPAARLEAPGSSADYDEAQGREALPIRAARSAPASEGRTRPCGSRKAHRRRS